MFERLAQIISSSAEIDIGDIKMDTNIRADMGLNSYELVVIIGEIEKEFNLSISDRDIFEMNTPADIIKYIEAHTPVKENE